MEEKRWNDNKLLIAQNDSKFFPSVVFSQFYNPEKIGKTIEIERKGLEKQNFNTTLAVIRGFFHVFYKSNFLCCLFSSIFVFFPRSN